MGNTTRIWHAMGKILCSLWICVTGANCDTHELNHQNILFFGGKPVWNPDGLKKFSILALEFLYFNCHVGTHLGHTCIPLDPGSMGWWLQLEVVGDVFVEVFPVLALGSLLLPVLSWFQTSPGTPEREQHPKQEPRCWCMCRAEPWDEHGKRCWGWCVCHNSKILLWVGKSMESLDDGSKWCFKIEFLWGMCLQLFVLEALCSWDGSNLCWSTRVF